MDRFQKLKHVTEAVRREKKGQKNSFRSWDAFEQV